MRVIRDHRGKTTLLITVLIDDGAVRVRVIHAVHVVGDIVKDITDVAGDLDAAGAAIGHAVARDLNQLICREVHAPFSIEIIASKRGVAAILDPEDQRLV